MGLFQVSFKEPVHLKSVSSLYFKSILTRAMLVWTSAQCVGCARRRSEAGMVRVRHRRRAVPGGAGGAGKLLHSHNTPDTRAALPPSGLFQAPGTISIALPHPRRYISRTGSSSCCTTSRTTRSPRRAFPSGRHRSGAVIDSSLGFGVRYSFE